MKRFRTRSRLRPEALALCCAAGLLLSSGCVTQGTHDRIVGGLERGDDPFELGHRLERVERVAVIDREVASAAAIPCFARTRRSRFCLSWC